MLNLQQKIAAGLTTGVFLTTVLVGSAFASDVTIDVLGNGKGSTNLVDVNLSNTNTVAQSNQSTNINSVSVTNNTGGNHANDNLGGSTATGGDATANVTIVNKGNSNSALSPCGCATSGDVEVTVAGNLKNSKNTAKVKQTNTNTTVQSNYILNLNTVTVKNKTGNNHANDNLGGSDATGGMANAMVKIKNLGGTNVSL